MLVISVTSGSKGGTGKTTILLNIAVLHAFMEQRRSRKFVLFIDAEPHAATATLLLSRELYAHAREGEKPGLVDYLLGEVDEILDIAYVIRFRSPEEFALLLVPGLATPDKLERLRGLGLRELHARLSKLIESAATELEAEAVYIDLPATTALSALSLAAYAVSDVIVPVGTPDPSCLVALYSAVTAIRDYIRPAPNIAPAVLNRITPANAIEPVTGMHYRTLYRKLLGVSVHEIPEDDGLSSARSAGMIEVLAQGLARSRALESLLKYAHKLITYPAEHRPRELVDDEKAGMLITTRAETEAERLLLALLRARGRKPV